MANGSFWCRVCGKGFATEAELCEHDNRHCLCRPETCAAKRAEVARKALKNGGAS